jgi:hypothetical protein
LQKIRWISRGETGCAISGQNAEAAVNMKAGYAEQEKEERKKERGRERE